MPTARNKKSVLIAAVFFLVMQVLVLVSIPRDTDNETVNITVKSGTGIYGIARLLKGEGIIYSSHLFALTSLITGGKLKAGEYDLRKSMSTIDIIRKMQRGERHIYALKIVEGYNLINIAETMESAHIMDKGAFMRLAKDRGFLARLGVTSDSLEGYLAPDTYYYSKEIDTDKFIERIAQRALKFFEKENIRNRMQIMGMDMHKTLTLASMIEKEAKMKNEKPLISAVFHNRLKKNMSLDCDPTVTYGTGSFSSPITRSDLVTYTPYNTYTFKGLPKGPICMPDRNSIMAALYPAQVDYLYFVSRNDGTHVFSQNIQAHNRFVTIYQRSRNSKNQ